MEISFSRSGGFAGMATAVSGKVVFDDGAAVVTSTGTTYRRVLSNEEASAVREAARYALAHAVSEAVGQQRDAYQYDLKISTSDGESKQLTSFGDSSDSSLQTLMDWVTKESDNIWDFRIHQSP